MPEQTWDTLAIDLQGPFPSGDNLLVMIDYRSRYPIVYLIRNTSAGKIIKCMNSTFSLFGYPKVLLSDNGPQFKSVEFRNYCEQHGIKQQLISPYYPAANGEVENMNRTLKKAIQRAHIEGKDWKKEIEKFLLAYRSTPHSSTGIAPADLLLKHHIRTDIPQILPSSKSLLDSKAEQKDASSKRKAKEYTDKKRHAKYTDFQIGDLVLLKNVMKQNKLSPEYENEIYTITKVHERSVQVQDTKGKYRVRNKAHVKKYFQRSKQSTTKDKSLHQSSEKATLPATPFYILPEQIVHNEEETTQTNAQQNRSRRSTRRRNKEQQL